MAIQKPTGTNDFLPADAADWQAFQATARRVFGSYGYAPIETPIIEQTDLFVRGIGEATDVVSKEMFTAISGENLNTLLGGGHLKAKQRLTMRPEGTAGVVRAVVEHGMAPQGAAPVKLMYAGPMFRAERPQEGRYRQFYQVGIECLGAEAPSVDAEGIIMLMRFFAQVGIPESSMTLLVNSMGCKECRPAYRDAVKAHIEAHAADMCEDCLRRAEMNPLRAFDCKNGACRAAMADAPRIIDYLCDDCAEHYAAVKRYLDMAGLAYAEDPRLVRGLDYYTRTVFEVQVAGSDKAQNAIGGGGRYDGLAEDIGGPATPGFGFALGYERCALALRAAGVQAADPDMCTLFVACVEDAQHDEAFRLVQACRDAGIAADMSHQPRSLKSQFKLADKLGAQFAVTLGPDEVAAGQATLRNMATHEERTLPLADIPAALQG